jgi:hypothetical protein
MPETLGGGKKMATMGVVVEDSSLGIQNTENTFVG